MDADSRKSTTSGLDRIFKSTLVFKMIEGYKYSVKISHTNTTAVNIMKSSDPGPKLKNWMVRFDNPHKNVEYAHINLRTKYTGIKDPHVKLPPGSITAVQGGAYIGKALDWLCYITVIVDGIQLGQAIYKDHKNGTMNNTAECAVDKTGQYVGGIFGAAIGKTVGSFLIPGIGPVVGAITFGILGVHYGSGYGSKSTSYFSNYWRERQLRLQREEEEKRKKEMIIKLNEKLLSFVSKVF